MQNYQENYQQEKTTAMQVSYAQMTQIKQEPMYCNQSEYWQQCSTYQAQYNDPNYATSTSYLTPQDYHFSQQIAPDYNCRSSLQAYSPPVSSYVTCKTEGDVLSDQLARSNNALQNRNDEDNQHFHNQYNWISMDILDIDEMYCSDRNSPFKNENSPGITLTAVDEEIDGQVENFAEQFDSSDLDFTECGDCNVYETEVETSEDFEDVQVEISDDESVSSDDSGYRGEDSDDSYRCHSITSTSRKQPILWKFLIKVLNDPKGKYNNMVRWVDKSNGVFEFTTKHKEEIAELWGQIKRNRCKMNYQKLARALRNYGNKGIVLRKVRRKLQYTFLPDMQKYIQAEDAC